MNENEDDDNIPTFNFLLLYHSLESHRIHHTHSAVQRFTLS